MKAFLIFEFRFASSIKWTCSQLPALCPLLPLETVFRLHLLCSKHLGPSAGDVSVPWKLGHQSCPPSHSLTLLSAASAECDIFQKHFTQWWRNLEDIFHVDAICLSSQKLVWQHAEQLRGEQVSSLEGKVLTIDSRKTGAPSTHPALDWQGGRLVSFQDWKIFFVLCSSYMYMTVPLLPN